MAEIVHQHLEHQDPVVETNTTNADDCKRGGTSVSNKPIEKGDDIREKRMTAFWDVMYTEEPSSSDINGPCDADTKGNAPKPTIHDDWILDSEELLDRIPPSVQSMLRGQTHVRGRLRVLDLGCGASAALCFALMKRFSCHIHVTGVDISEQAIMRAEQSRLATISVMKRNFLKEHAANAEGSIIENPQKENVSGWQNSDQEQRIDALEKQLEFFVADATDLVLVSNQDTCDVEQERMATSPNLKRFPPHSFDLIFDKGTSDTLRFRVRCRSKEMKANITDKLFQQVNCVLKPSGVLCVISPRKKILGLHPKQPRTGQILSAENAQWNKDHSHFHVTSYAFVVDASLSSVETSAKAAITNCKRSRHEEDVKAQTKESKHEAMVADPAVKANVNTGKSELVAGVKGPRRRVYIHISIPQGQIDAADNGKNVTATQENTSERCPFCSRYRLPKYKTESSWTNHKRFCEEPQTVN